jgi:hypothetical protein
VFAAELSGALADSQRPDGAWGYYPGKSGRLESTCWALLALARHRGAAVAVAPLRGWPAQNGWLIDVPGAPVNVAFNALAAVVLLEDPDGRTLAAPIVSNLVSTQGVALQPLGAIRQDSSLRAWPWIDQTFSWVEPTALALLALKKARRRGVGQPSAIDARIEVGERMLVDRACRQGGWNYGNSNVYGQELWPYVPTTALGLMAMQDRRTQAVVPAALQSLQKDSEIERSAVALALAAICLRIYGVAGTAIESGLVDSLELSRSIGNIVGLAMGLYALSGTQDADAFRI